MSRLVAVKLNTFHTQTKSKKTITKESSKGKSSELRALLRMTQIVASGGEVDVIDFIGNHECSKYPPSLFYENEAMRAGGTKASLVKVLKEQTGVVTTTNVPKQVKRTAVVVDAMYAMRRSSFQKDETFGSIATRYRNLLLADIPAGTEIIHFCCDRYDESNIKTAERQHRYGQSRTAKVYEVTDNFRAPSPQEFFSASANTANLQRFLCEKWSEDEKSGSFLHSTRLYLSGGFKEATKTVLLTGGSVTDVSDLVSTQQEADTRVILHTIYSFRHEDAERVIIHANDTDIIVTSLYYCATFLKELPELWVRTAPEVYLPIHDLAAALGLSQCRALPFIHSLSGRDTTSYPYFTGKRSWIKSSILNDTSALEDFGEDSNRDITQDMFDQARRIVIGAYTSQTDDFRESSLANLRAYKFLNNKSTVLSLLPPTEDAFLLHVKRVALATIVDKSAHVCDPVVPLCTDFGWVLDNKIPVPIPSTKPTWPGSMKSAVSCGCIKGCSRNCSCARCLLRWLPLSRNGSEM